MNPIPLYLFLLSSLSLFAQEKGVSPLKTQNAQVETGATYALVVGISDYQDENIPDLRFADKDAEAFAVFLQSPAGGSLDGDHLKVLLNKQATASQFAIALDWLWEVVKENDRVIIYFSGHGDVEKKSITQPGYLLCWDAPARVYMAGGAFNVRDLNDVVSTLSIQNKAKVILVTDACRAGKLSGSGIGGSQATAANLAKQYANEIKILSCQPDEYSIEGEQWGGGRGAFSYHLLDGLYGMADGNNDASVNLKEISRYLEDRVSEEVAPQNQNPMTIGGVTEKLTDVFPEILAALKEGKRGQLQLFTATESRGIEDDVLAQADTIIVEMYAAFQQAIKDKNFLEPVNACAEYYYEILSKEPQLERLHSSLKRNYAAALQDEAQQTLNEWLKIGQQGSFEPNAGKPLPRKTFREKVKTYPHYLDRAAELLGSKHYMYATLKARQYFFEGYLLENSDLMNPGKEMGELALTKFRYSLEWQPEQPHVFWRMAMVFGNHLEQPDSLEYYTRQAMEMHPQWKVPCEDAAHVFSIKYRQFDRALPFLAQASQIDSTDPGIINAWAVYYFNQRNFAEAEIQFSKALAIDSTFVWAWSNLGVTYAETGRRSEAEKAYTKALALDSTIAWVWRLLGVTLNKAHRYTEAEQAFKKAIQLDSSHAYIYNSLGTVYYYTQRYEKAEELYNKATQIDSTFALAYANLALSQGSQNRTDEAFSNLEKAMKNGFNYYDDIQKIGEFASLREQKDRWEAMMQRAIVADEADANAWNKLGYVYIRARNYPPAEAAMRQAVALDTTSALFRSNLGFIYLNLGRYEEAEVALKKAIALDSTFANACKHLGTVFFKSNRPEEARQNFLKALELSPNYADAMLGMAYLLHSEGKTAEALGYVEQAIGKGSTFEQLQSDEDLAPLRTEASVEWKALMQKYFPDPYKD